MDRDKKARKAVRGSFTAILNKLNAAVKEVDPDKDDIRANFELLELRAIELTKLNETIFQHLLDGDASDEEFTSEISTADEYQRKYYKIQIEVLNILKPAGNLSNIQDGDNVSTVSSRGYRRKFKLPDIELKKFNGDIKEWIHFWGQFKKIDEDEELAEEDKFQYLIQATKEGSRAREFVNSFPPSAKNYKNVVDGLKRRFGKEDMLIEVYVRELLILVVKKTVNKENVNLCALYDQLESHLRALESLGVTSEKYAAMLYPLIESCLPEDLLRIWQRMSTLHKEDASSEINIQETSTIDKRLTKLMSFISSEVQNEERIKLASTGFNLTNETKSKKKNFAVIKESDVSTATSLVSVSNEKFNRNNNTCIFCDKKHNSADCCLAKKMSLDERKKVIEDKKCCFYCLKTNHFARKCRSFIKCTICDGRHIILMCPSLNKCRESYSFKKQPEIEAETTQNGFTSLLVKSEILLQTLVVKVKEKEKSMLVRAIIDTGSQKSYISEEIANKMNFERLGKVILTHALFGGIKTEQQEHQILKVNVGSTDNKYNCSIEALSQPTIVSNISHIKHGKWTQEIQNLGISLTDSGKVKGPIHLLIGADAAGELYTGDKEQLKCGLVALETKLGWTLMGAVNRDKKEMTTTAISLFINSAKIQDIWELDTLGIKDPVEVKQKHEKEREVEQRFQESVKINESGRYEVRLPWISDKPELPTNYDIAKRRLSSVVRKLQAECNLEQYEEVLQDWCKEGIIQEIDDHVGGHFLPHRHVIKEGSTTRIRPVFDASAKIKTQPSLNECLEVGPNLIEKIPAVLLRFRLEKIGVISDIKRAFLQISVAPEDRNYLKFLWRDENGKIKVYQHNRVVFGVTSSPFLLGAVINYHLNNVLKDVKNKKVTDVPEETINKLIKCFYVDNCVTSVGDENELIQFINQSRTVMSRACFDLRGWEHTRDNDSKENSTVSVLGLKWNKFEDTLEINLNFLKPFNDFVVTKRLILSIAHKLFDPIGFLSPINIYPKLMLQNTWQSGIGWDEEVNEDTRTQFNNWYKELSLLSKVKIPRWIIGEANQMRDISIHTFCDASKTAYGAVVFIRVNAEKVNIQLLQAKARVAPLKKITIPRLELMAATIAARLTENILNFLGWIEIPVYYWTDSTTVLMWLKENKKQEIFVKNRIKEIKKMTKVKDWRHVPGEMNPADLPSRGCSIKHFVEQKWWEGPAWLKLDPHDWPKNFYNLEEEEESEEQFSTILSVYASEPNWYYNYFDKYEKIVRLISWITRFVDNCKKKKENRLKNDNLSCEEIVCAEKLVVKLIQREFYNDENYKKLATLNTFRDQDNIIRVKTKVTLREDTENFKFPIVLPDRHPVVKLLIMDRHKRHMHAGVQILLNLLREEFWITKGRRAVREVLKNCITCKRHSIKNIETPSCPLPLNRVRDASVFEVTGVDYAGPLHLKGGQKVWICLFTCAVYRAIHLELVSTLSTVGFLQALRRFIARRGRPKTFYSDNGTNFVGTENLFSTIDWENIKNYTAIQRMEWKFNPPTAAWWGGWWERIIRIVKDLLRRVLGKACLKYEEMLTLLIECEGIVNSRPLTYVPDGDPEVAPICPNMFLQEINEVGVPDLDQIDSNTLNKRVLYVNKLRLHLKQRFRNEYLGCLKQKSNKDYKIENLQVGELVLVGSDSKKRLDWPMAKIIEMITGRDGECRLVKLKTANGEILRPVQRIHRLEIKTDVTKNEKTEKIVTDNQIPIPVSENVVEDNQMPIQDNEPRMKDIRLQTTSTRSGRKVCKPKRFL